MEDQKAHQDIHNTGCAWGRVNRTKIENVVEDVNNIQKWLQLIIILLLTQLFGFVAATFWFLANRAIP